MPSAHLLHVKHLEDSNEAHRIFPAGHQFPRQPRDRLPALPDDEFYHADLIGLEVMDTGGAMIGHVKAEHRMDRNYLKGNEGDRANAVLAAAGYNFRLLLRWFEAFLRLLFATTLRARIPAQLA